MIHAYHGATISSPHVMIRCDRIEAKTLHKLHAKFHIVTKFVWHYRGNERKPKWFQSAERWLFKQNICRVCRVGRWALVKKLLKIACFIRVTVKVYCWNPAVAHFFNKGSAKHILPDSGQSCSFLPELATKKQIWKGGLLGAGMICSILLQNEQNTQYLNSIAECLSILLNCAQIDQQELKKFKNLKSKKWKICK